MFRKIVLFLLFNFLFLIFNFASVSAHVLKADGSIGAVLHISPDDDPVAGEQSSFFFEFKDKEGRFKAEECDCKIFITASAKEILAQQLTNVPDSNNLSFNFTFPQPDIYKVKVAGKSNNGQFQEFVLEYDIRVELPAENSSSNSFKYSSWISQHIIHLIGAFVIAGFFVYALIKQSRNSEKK